VFAGTRYFFADLFHWVSLHRLATAAIALVVVAIGAGAVYLLSSGDNGGGATATAPGPAPKVVIKQSAPPKDTSDLGFPTFATKNTTRVSGADAIADAAAVALAVYPSTGGIAGPSAVALVDTGEWQAGVAAASLAAAPIGAPTLVTDSGELPPLTDGAIRELDPQGSASTAGRNAFVIGAAATPDGLDTLDVKGSDPAELAAEIDKLRQRLADDPNHILIASSDDPGYAMPAAGWAARSGDPVLFAGKDDVPDATVAALRSHDGVPVYVLGPEAAISAKTMDRIKQIAPGAERVGADGVAENSVAFARYVHGDFGWNINDPGHGFVLANSERPLDAAAAAPLSASGTWGPLLVTDDGAKLGTVLSGYLLDLKPGYESDPTRALYNHVWLIGDTSALSVDLQAQADDLAEVAPVTSGSGPADLGPAPGTPESQPAEPKPQKPNRNQ
jgi:ell wall binding domain 2 (CWB2)